MTADRGDVLDHRRSHHNLPDPPSLCGRVCALTGDTWSGMFRRTSRTGIYSPLCPAVPAAVVVFSAPHSPRNVPM